VHRFRTYGRRIEALLDAISPEPRRNDKKLLKLLARLRKKAGRVRDLDVQLSALRNLKMPEAPGQKAQLIQMLSGERIVREDKLRKAFDESTVRQVRKHLKRVAESVPESTDPVMLAKKCLASIDKDSPKMSEKLLHQYRIAGKRARYLAELGGKDPEAQQIIGILKRMQDVIGDWHDWLKLTQRAEGLFGAVQDSHLVAALRNIAQAKYRQAMVALQTARTELAELKVQPSPAARKSTTPERKQAAAAAAA
jgi:CHAD domain-containing protein